MNNPINISGDELENQIESILRRKNIGFKRADNAKSQIDFLIHTDEIMYVECHNQNTGGSVEEKIPHKVFKYSEIYKMKTMWLVTGKHKLNRRVLNHIAVLEKIQNVKVNIVNIDEITQILESTPPKTNKFF